MTSFDNRIRELVAHAYAKSPAIRQIFDSAGVGASDIQSAADLVKLPVTSKDSLVEIHQANPPFGGFLTIPIDDLPRIYISPGPIYDPQPQNPDNTEHNLAPFRYVGFGRGDRVLNTFMYHLTPAGLLLDEALRACNATVIPSGPGNTELQIMMMSALNITGFVGQPSYLETLIDKALEMGFPKEMISIKKALFSAEIYTPKQQARFEGEFGMKTTSAYGTADLGFIGYSRSDKQGFSIVESVYIEIVDPETGQTVPDGEKGEIVVTTFNKAYPLIRFGTGDLGALDPNPTHSAQHLMGLFGRSGEAIKVRGMFLHPNQLLAAKTQFPQIKRMQAVISRPEKTDYVTIRVQLENGVEAGDLADKLKTLAQQAVRLRVDEVIFVDEGVIQPGARTVLDERKWD